MDSFCGSSFWDLNVTWHTNNPEFPQCFERTILVWIPSTFLLLFSPLQIYTATKSQRSKIPIFPLGIYQHLLALGLALLQVVQYCTILWKLDDSGRTQSPADNIGAAVKFATYVLALSLQVYTKRKGIPSSSTLFFFWLLEVACSAFEFASAISSQPERYVYGYKKIHHIFTFISFPLAVAELFLHFFADNPPEASIQDDTDRTHQSSQQLKNKPCPEYLSSIPNRYTYQWMYSLLWSGYKRPLEIEDLWELDEENKSLVAFERFNKHWRPRFIEAEKWKNLNNDKNQSTGNDTTKQRGVVGKPVTLLPSLWKAIWKIFVASAVCKVFEDLLSFASPQILSLLIAHVAVGSNEERWKGYFYVGLLFLVLMMQTVFNTSVKKRIYQTGMRIQTILSEAVYRKSLLLSNTARQESTTGQILNLMCVDAQIFKDQLYVFHHIWSGPLVIFLAVYFLWDILGIAALIGMAVFLLLTLGTVWLAIQNKALRTKQMKRKDERMRLMNEMLAGIKILKMYAWEPAFEKQIGEIRNQEIKLLRVAAYLTTTGLFINSTTMSLMKVKKEKPLEREKLHRISEIEVSLVSFTSYVLLDENNVLSAQKIFVTLAIFNMMQSPIMGMSSAFSNLVHMKVSLNRLMEFLNAEEIDPSNVTHQPEENGTVVRIEKGTFSWDARSADTTLKNIDLKVKQGALVAVVGIVGSGKSSLLSAILGEMEKQSGKVNTVGSIAYLSQQAWIQNATLRDNILFGKKFDPKLYDKIIDACALRPDLEILAGGDMTEIGENGINLSGGQKQRVALARAVYNQADIYLLDDPLSAVDALVGQHIFKEIIGSNGLLRNKTRIVVTHGITYLPNVDEVIVLSNGEISEAGTFTELRNNRGAFADFLAHHTNSDDNDTIIADSTNVEMVERNRITINEETLNIFGNSSRRTNPPPLMNADPTARVANSVDNQITDLAKLVKAEVKEVGSIKNSVYVFLLKSVSWKIAISSIWLYIISHVFNLYSSFQLSEWAYVPTVNGTQDVNERNVYLGVYGGLIAGDVITLFFANLLTTLGFLKASQVMHSGMLARVLRSPMVFFDTTPMGRIINKFSKDLDAPDNSFPQYTLIWLGAFFRILISLIGISINAPLFLIFLIPVGGVFLFFQIFYSHSSQELKRLDSVTRSPIFSSFGETLTGTTTIRAFKAQQQCLTEFQRNSDRNQMAYYPFICTKTWFSMILETFGNSIVLFTSLFVLITNTREGSVGMSIMYALSVTANLTLLVSASITLQNSFVSVERIKEYFEIEQEAAWETPSKQCAANWPQLGSIAVKNFQIRYRKDLDLVLKNIDCKINPAEKVAVVGRTGAGKSSLTLGLFRIMEAAGGSIEIDGVNIAELGLHDVRGRLTIIPQDPVLFGGTLRINLDPHERFSDEQIWQALEFAHLKELILSLSGGLEAPINENGSNFSVGQRQLVCLARALLRKTKILVLDEATAAVDLETDDLIQQTIRSEFKESTVLTIAHRLNTIMDYDRIIVLDQGLVVEFDTPQELLQNTDSIFFSMAREAKIV